MKKRIWLTAAVLSCALAVNAFEYNVRKPAESLRPTFRAEDTQPGVWTLNYEDALAKAKAAGRYAVMFYTAAWWCPYCETCEEMVLLSDVWKSYVEKRGFYLVMMDFPYRYAVPSGQEYKGAGPDGTGKPGWGFQCWLYDDEYLADNGLTRDEGLQYIEKMYAIQNAMALPSADVSELDNWNGTGKIQVGKVGYPTFVVFNPEGEEIGRASFPWYRSSDVTESEAREYLIQQLEQIINGKCKICDDPSSGTPDVSVAQTYSGWLTDAAGGTVGTVTVKTSKMNAKKTVKAKVSMTVNGKKVNFSQVETGVDGCVVCGDEVSLNDFRVVKKNYTADIGLGEKGVTGVLNDGVNTYTVNGGVRGASAIPMGNWNLVIKNGAGKTVSEFARGYGTLSLAIKKNGKVKVSGTLGDGTRVSVSTIALAGDNGIVCVPVRADLYLKKGGLGFVAWFKDGKLLSIDDVSDWVSAGKRSFVCPIGISSTMSSGIGSVPYEPELTITDFASQEELGGLPLATDHSIDEVTVTGSHWKGSDLTRFDARCTQSTGVLRGKMKFRVVQKNGRLKNISGAFYGIVMGGSGYGTVVVKNEGSWAVKIAVCGSCSE